MKRAIEVFNGFWDRWAWAIWLVLLVWNLYPPASRPLFVAIAAFFTGLRLHQRFGSTLIGRKGERLEWKR